MKKRIISALLAVCLLLGMVPTVSAADPEYAAQSVVVRMEPVTQKTDIYEIQFWASSEGGISTFGTATAIDSNKLQPVNGTTYEDLTISTGSMVSDMFKAKSGLTLAPCRWLDIGDGKYYYNASLYALSPANTSELQHVYSLYVRLQNDVTIDDLDKTSIRFIEGWGTSYDPEEEGFMPLNYLFDSIDAAEDSDVCAVSLLDATSYENYGYNNVNPNTADTLSVYYEFPGADKATLGSFTVNTEEIAVPEAGYGEETEVQFPLDVTAKDTLGDPYTLKDDEVVTGWAIKGTAPEGVSITQNEENGNFLLIVKNTASAGTVEVEASIGDITGSGTFTIIKDEELAEGIAIHNSATDERVTADTLLIPANGGAYNQVGYYAVVYNQFGTEYSGSYEIEWTGEEYANVEYLQVSNYGHVTVNPGAAEGTLTYTAKYDGMEEDLTVTLERGASEIDSVVYYLDGVETDEKEVVCPAIGEADETYDFSVKVFDQYGEDITDQVDLTFDVGGNIYDEGNPPYITPVFDEETGKITVPTVCLTSDLTISVSAAMEDDTFIAHTFVLKAVRAESVPTTVEFMRNGNKVDDPDTIGIPASGSKEYIYGLIVYDQYGEPMSTESTDWVFGYDEDEIPGGVEFSGRYIIVSSTAEEGEFELVGRYYGVSGSITISVSKVQVNWPDAITTKTGPVYGDTYEDIVISLGTATATDPTTGDELEGELTVENPTVKPDAGTNTVTIRFTVTEGDYGGYTVTKEYPITPVAKAQGRHTVQIPDEITYGDSYEPSLAEGGTGYTDVEYDYYSIKDTSTPLTYKPTDVGEYVVIATITGDSNHNDCTAQGSFKIVPKTIDFDASVSNKIYDGTTDLDPRLVDVVWDGLIPADEDDFDDFTVSGTYDSANVGEDVNVNVKVTLTTDNYRFENNENVKTKAVLADIRKAPASNVTAQDHTVNVVVDQARGYFFGLDELSLVPAFGELGGIDVFEIGEPSTGDVISSKPVTDGTNIYIDAKAVSVVKEKADSFELTLGFGNFGDVTITVYIDLVEKTPVDVKGVSVADVTYGTTPSYTGTPVAYKEDTDTVQPVTGTYTYTWYTKSGIKLDAAPTDAGEYELIVELDDINYMGSQIVEFEIRPMDVTMALGSLTSTYGDTPDTNNISFQLYNTLPYNDAAAVLLAGIDFSVDASKVDAGTYTGAVTGEDNNADDNYNITVTAGDLIIEKRVVTIKDIYVFGRVYNGTNIVDPEDVHIEFDNVLGSDATFTYIVSGTYDSANADPYRTASGTVTLTGPNYTFEGGASEEFTCTTSIFKADADGVDPETKTVKVVINQEREYSISASEFALNIGSGCNAGTLGFYRLGLPSADIFAVYPVIKGGNTITFTSESIAAAKVGACSFNVELTSENYNNVTVTISIDLVEKTPVDVKGVEVDTAIYGDTPTYTGTPVAYQEGTDTVQPVTGTYTYTWYTRTGTKLDAAPTDVGEYTLVVELDDINYIGSQRCDFEIVAKDVTLVLSDLEITYGETPDPANVGGSTEDTLVGSDTVNDLLDGINITIDDTKTNAGTHTGAVTGADNNAADNYNITVVPGNLIIDRLEIEVDASTVIYYKTYDGTTAASEDDSYEGDFIVEGVITPDDVICGFDVEDIVLATANAGSTTATIEIYLGGDDAENYKLKESTVTVAAVISKRYQENVTVTVNKSEVYFGNTSVKVTAAGGNGTGAYQYISSDESIATIDAQGKVTILASGEVSFTAKKLGDDNWEESEVSNTVTLVIKPLIDLNISATTADTDAPKNQGNYEVGEVIRNGEGNSFSVTIDATESFESYSDFDVAAPYEWLVLLLGDITVDGGDPVEITDVEIGGEATCITDSTDFGGDEYYAAIAYPANLYEEITVTITVDDVEAELVITFNPNNRPSFPGQGTGNKDEEIEVDSNRVSTEFTPDMDQQNGVGSGEITEEEAKAIADAADEAGSRKVVINAETEDAHRVRITIPAELFEKLQDTEAEKLVIETELGDIEIPADEFSGLDDEDLDITITQTAAGINLEFEGRRGAKAVNGTANFDNPTAGDVAAKINEDGSLEVIRKSAIIDGVVYVPFESGMKIIVINNAKSFIDIDTHWAKSAIDFVTARDLFAGYGEDFRPGATVTRAMVVTVLHRLEGEILTASGKDFTDVPAGQWYSNAIDWASNNGIVLGYGETFAPNGLITREQLAAILYRYADHLGLDVSDRADLTDFGDMSSVSGYAVDAMEYCVANGFITGKPGMILDPKGYATRAELAVILQRFIVSLY